ncbi:MAG: FHA domain-containing serine/threonine-protein kinase [Planctomycetota bacterium]
MTAVSAGGVTIDALCALARQQGLRDAAALERLAEVARRAGVDSPATMRAFILGSDMLGDALRRALTQALPPRDDLRYGAITIAGHLAVGGMGDVWLGTTPDGALCVVKTIRPDVANPDFIRRFDREVRLTARIRSPHVVRCIDFGIAGERSYLALEHVAGGDLHHLIRQHGRLNETEAVSLAIQIARGLHAAHACDLVHRDLKPKNVFITAAGVAKLGDFGLARSTSQQRTMLTMTGTTVGTPAYMSPEQVRGHDDLDIRTDIYALGVVLYECLIGRPPFAGGQAVVLRAHLSQAVGDVRSLRPELSERVARTIIKCMAKEPGRRFSSPSRLVHSLEQTLRSCAHDDATLAPGVAAAAVPDATLSGGEVVARGASPPPVAPVLRQGSPAGIDPMARTATVAAPAAAGYSGDWLVLCGSGALAGQLIHCFARSRLLFGKKRSEPVDVCLRVYPIAEHDAACRRISRQHFELAWDPANGELRCSDCGSANGTTLDGQVLRRSSCVLQPGGHRLSVPSSIALTLACRQPEHVMLTREGNRPSLAYVMVLHRFTIGGPLADLALPAGGAGLPMLELEQVDGRWRWRLDRSQPWAPLALGQDWESAGLPLQAVAGSHDHFV